MLCSAGGLDSDKVLKPLKDSPYLINQKFLGKSSGGTLKKDYLLFIIKENLTPDLKSLSI
jgi:hypothetical protein